MITTACDTVEDSILVRRGRLGDLKPMLSIERAAFGRYALEASTLFWLLFRRWPGLLVAERSSALVGYVITRVSLFPWPKRRGGITSIAVHPAYLRQGIGRTLMEAALEFLRLAGVRAIDLEVGVKNRAAMALYRSLGFAEVGPLPDYYGLGEDGVRMSLELPEASAGREEAGEGRRD